MPQKYKPKKPRKFDNALIFSKGPYGELAKRVHKFTDKYRSLTYLCCLSMLLSLVLSYYKCKKCPMGIYSERFILGVKKMHGRIRGREGFYFLDFMVCYDFTISFRDYKL